MKKRVKTNRQVGKPLKDTDIALGGVRLRRERESLRS